MDTIKITGVQLIPFLLVFFRIGAIFTAAPFFGSKNIPARVKAPLCFAIAIIVVMALTKDGGWDHMLPVQPRGLIDLLVLIFKEISFGAAIGYTAQLAFVGAQMAGQLVGHEMGLSMARMVDPTTRANITVIAQFNSTVAMLMFLFIHGHHYILRGIAKSFSAVPLGQWSVSISFVDHLSIVFGSMFSTGLKIALPVMSAVFLTKIALAIVARTMPQMNIFVVGFPLQIAVGFIAMAISLPLFVKALRALFVTMQHNMLGVFLQQ
jgi:flagellar biosynthetic protein FliR